MGIELKMALLAAAAVLAGCAAPEEADVGRALFLDHCVACHGPSGRGDGPAAAGLDRPVADLTRIAARRGGTFPMAEVMSTIDGYTRVRHGSVTMPEFGPALLDGPTVLYDTGDGVPSPTPAGLVALAEYLRSIQR